MENKAHTGSVIRRVTVFRAGALCEEERELVEEVACRITADGLPAGRLSCSPWGVRQAAIGSLYMQGIIEGADDILSLEISDKTGAITVVTRKKTHPSHRPIEAETTLSASEVICLAEMLEEHSRLFRRTGGVHCAALARNGEFLAYEEDVSRHAAIDKLAGSCLTQHIPMAGSCLVFSGRVPGEILCKAVKMGCSVVIARGAPTDHACRVAEQQSITLIGFAREDSFTVYACPHRITTEQQ